MDGKVRREAILRLLSGSREPLSAGAMAAELGVSRQIIVGDVALLRAAGMDIAATPRGYQMAAAPGGLLAKIACCHQGEEMEAELTAMVDYGCRVLDVIVAHPVYGEITAPLELSSRYDVEAFLKKCQTHQASPLSALTGGIHLHTVSAPNEETLHSMKENLRSLGILVEEQ